MPPRSSSSLSSSARWLVLAGVWFVYFCFGLTATSLAPLVAPIARDLDLSHTAMGGVLGVWQLVFIASAVPCGSLLDRLGARRALFLGVLAVALSGLMRGFADNGPELYLAVALFGLGGPIVSTGAPKVIARWFEGSERGLAMGLYITGPSLGGIAALTLSHTVMLPLLDGDWRALLWLWAAVTLVAGGFWLVIAHLPAVRRHDDAEEAAAPVLPQRQVLGELLRLPVMPVMLLLAVGIFAYGHGSTNWMPELLRQSGMSASEAGYWAAIPTLVGILGALAIPRLATPGRRIAILTLLSLSAMFAMLALLGEGRTVIAAGLVLQGIARSSMMTVALLLLLESPGVGTARAGTASGLFFAAAEIGGAGGPFAVGLLYDATGSFDAGLIALAAVAGGMLGLLLLLRRIASRQAAEGG